MFDLTLAFVLIVAAILFRVFYKWKPETMYCKRCGHVAEPVSHTKGSFVLEIVLWFMLIVPGLIYSTWRVTTRHKVRRHCGAEGLIPPDSPLAKNQVQ